MGNHYHAIFQTPDGNLSSGMQWFHGSYSAWFNTRHQRVGPLFQGRYRAIPVEDSAWAYRLSFYVHLNPLCIAQLGLDKTGKVLESKGLVVPTKECVTERLALLRIFPWSSYRVYAGYTVAPPWLEYATLLDQAGKPETNRCARYRDQTKQLLTRGVEPGIVERLRDAVAIGSADFGSRIKRDAAHQLTPAISGKKALRRRIAPETVRSWVETIKGEAWSCFAHRQGDWGCALFLWGAKRYCGLTLRELGEAAGGIQFSAVNKLISRFEQQAKQSLELQHIMQRLTHLSNVEP
jgi:hypothetical protein